MDRLVYGFAKINFQQNCEDILTENQGQNFNCDSNKPTPQAPATPAGSEILHLLPQIHIPIAAAQTTTPFSINKFDLQMDSSNEDMDEHTHSSKEDETDGKFDDEHDAAHTSTARFSQRRNMPSRSCKENSFSKTKRRSIMKPTKRVANKATEFSMRPKDIKKIYLNKKLTNFRPANLETIFEEPQMTTADEDTGRQVCFVGRKKMRRSLSCSDGFNINRTLAKQRRAKIKKTFGRRFALKKISLQDFMEHINKSFAGGNESKVDANATATANLATSSNIITTENVMDADTVMNMNSSATNFKTASMQSLQEFDLIETTEDNYAEAGVLIKSNSFSGACFTTATTTANDVAANHIHDDIALL